MNQTPWAELQLAIPGYIGHQARAALAQRAAGSLPLELFNYALAPDSPDGMQALPQPPAIRFFGNGKTVRVVGVRREGALLLYRHAQDIARFFEIGSRRWSLREGTFEARPSWPHTYRVDAFVANVPPGLVSMAKARVFDDAALLELLQVRLRDAVARQCALLQIEPVPIVTLDRITRAVAVNVKARKYFIAFDVEALINAQLVGPWQLGRLQARGYGRVVGVRA